MAGLAYFLPNLASGHLVGPDRRLSRALLRDRGLEAALADCETADHVAINDLHAHGPGGKSGLIVYPLPKSGQLPARMTGYFPAGQIWAPAFGDPEAYWIGHDPAEPPTPADLARRGRGYQGHDLELGPDRTLTIPIVRRPHDRYTALPCEISFDRAGKTFSQIAAEYADLWEAMAPYIDAIFFDGEKDFDISAAIGLAARIVGINYRFGPAEQNVLRWLKSTNWGLVLQKAMDLPFYERAVEDQKKTESPTSPASTTSPGPTAACPITAPAGENC